jgi:hypothetical protein
MGKGLLTVIARGEGKLDKEEDVAQSPPISPIRDLHAGYLLETGGGAQNGGGIGNAR